jgi:hypothetical protein
MFTAFSRRRILKSAGTLLTLPTLGSLGFRRSARATAAAVPPKRMVCLGIGYGVTEETWFPKRSDTGADYTLPEGLAPLARHKNDFTVVQGCSHKFANNPHGGSTFWLTGANPFGAAGQSFHNSISMDQLAAAQLGRDTRFTSIQLNASEPGMDGPGHGTGLSLAWDHRGKPMAGFNSPVIAFHKLFSSEDTPLDQRQKLLAEKRSVLDAVLVEAKAIDGKLSADDRRKLDEYFESIREIETRLAKDEAWMARPKPKAEVAQPAAEPNGIEETRLMQNLMMRSRQKWKNVILLL